MRTSVVLGSVAALLMFAAVNSVSAQCRRCCAGCCEPNIVVHLCPEKECCGKSRRESYPARRESAPFAPVVESAPVFGYAMPMMFGVAPVGAAGLVSEAGYLRRERSTAESAAADDLRKIREDMARLSKDLDRVTVLVDKHGLLLEKLIERTFPPKTGEAKPPTDAAPQPPVKPAA